MINRESQLQQYKKFIENCTTVAKSVKNYTDFKRINECLGLLFPEKNDISILDFDDPDEFKPILEDLPKQKKFIDYDSNETGGGRKQYSNALKRYWEFLAADKKWPLLNKFKENTNITKDNSPLQTIFYGTPGSGKSHKVKELVKESYFDEQELEEFVFRTTFHPDSDYASFVGCYKPVMKCVVNVDIDDKIYNKEQLITKILEFKATGTSYVYHRFGAKYWRSLNKLSAQDLKDIIKKNDPNADADNQYTELSKGMKVGEYLSNENVKEEISYEFIPQVFTKAYVKAWKTREPVYLIIEEINRGNCAQIFGNLFQLLDRKDGISEYPIDADYDLKDYLEKELGVGHDGIANGKLKLPANLNILATMNTSDQSLFPMDSAFKRRWSWKCVPVDYKNPDSEKFTIKIGEDKEYNWHKFLKIINKKIKDITDSEDKQMGNFFITGDIDKDQFVDKVMFYLWNDIFKEEYNTSRNHFRYKKNESDSETTQFSFNELFDENSMDKLIGFLEYIMSLDESSKTDD